MKISKGKVVPAQTTESYVGTEVQLHLFLTQTLDGVSGEGGLTAPAALPRTKSLLCSLNRKLAGQLSRSGHFGEDKNLLTLL
jgi:hypothetical protein